MKMVLYHIDKSTGAKDNWDVTNLNPRGIVGRIYAGDH